MFYTKSRENLNYELTPNILKNSLFLFIKSKIT